MHITGLLPLVFPALADFSDREISKKHFEAGRAYYKRGEYEKALEEFKKSYALFPNDDLRYNMGSCLKKLGRLEEAVQAFQAYVEWNPHATDRGEVETMIRNLQEEIKSNREEGVRGEEIRGSETREEVDLSPASREEEPIPYRPLMWGSLGLAVVSGVTGVACLFLARGENRKYKSVIREGAKSGEIAGKGGNRYYADEEASQAIEPELANHKSRGEKFAFCSKVGLTVTGLSSGAAGVFHWLNTRQGNLTLNPQMGEVGIMNGAMLNYEIPLE